MEFRIYTDISVGVFQIVKADTAQEALKIAEERSQLLLCAKLNGTYNTSVDETLGYCMADEDANTMNEQDYFNKYGVAISTKY